MRNDEIIQMLEVQDLPEHFQIVAETCGIETARILIKELGGISISIPKISSLRSLIMRYVMKNASISVKQLAKDLDMNERVVANILKQISKNV